MFVSNPRSVCNKIDLLDAKLVEENIDIVILNETWMTSSVPNSFVSNHYNFYRNDRNNGHKGGGVLIGVKTNLKSIDVSNDSSFEDLFRKNAERTYL